MNIFRYNFIIKKVSENAFFSPMKKEMKEMNMKNEKIENYKMKIS